MSGLDGLQLDSDGYLDMDQFPDDGTDLADAELAQLRDTLHADPVEEPTDQEWDAMFDEVVAGEDTGPFAVDDTDALPTDLDADGDDVFGLGESAGEELDSADDGSTDDDGSAASDDGLSDDGLPDGLPDDGLADDGPALDDGGIEDLDLTYDDGGLDLTPDDVADDAFAADALDDAPADIANNDFEDLL